MAHREPVPTHEPCAWCGERPATVARPGADARCDRCRTETEAVLFAACRLMRDAMDAERAGEAGAGRDVEAA